MIPPLSFSLLSKVSSFIKRLLITVINLRKKKVKKRQSELNQIKVAYVNFVTSAKWISLLSISKEEDFSVRFIVFFLNFLSLEILSLQLLTNEIRRR